MSSIQSPNNPFERRFRSTGGGLAQLNAPEGTLIAYATAPGKVAADGEGDNGLYTRELLKALNAPGLKVEDVFKQVRINVSRASDGNQTPWEASSLVGDFYFVPRDPMAERREFERQVWGLVEDSESIAELQLFVRQFPDGAFATPANDRLSMLRARQPAPAPQPAVTAAPVVAAVKPEAAPTPDADTRYLAAVQAWLNLSDVERERKSRPQLDDYQPAGRLDGFYNAKFTLSSMRGFERMHASITVRGETITGFAAAYGGSTQGPGGACFIGGKVDQATGEIISLGLSCGTMNVTFKGRFSINDGKIEALTDASSVMDNRVVPVRWVQ